MRIIRFNKLFLITAAFIISFLILAAFNKNSAIDDYQQLNILQNRQLGRVNVFFDVGTNNGDSVYEFFGIKNPDKVCNNN